jgi:hypothetical protein
MTLSTLNKERNQITSIWNATLTVWKQRCDALHDIEKKYPVSFKQLLPPKISSTIRHATEHRSIEQQALNQPMTTTMNLPIKHLKGWTKQTDSFI